MRPSYYREKFGIEVMESFASELAWLLDEGFAEIGDDKIELTRDGLLQVDRLLHEFFLPHIAATVTPRTGS